MSFLDKIKLTNKKVYILGGFGLIGSKVVTNILSIGAKVIILDVQKKKIPNNVKYEKFDCSKSKTLDKNFNRIIKKLGESKKFTMILEKKVGLYFDQSVDLTTLATQTYNKTK